MPPFFRKQEGEPVSREDYATLCMRFACEAGGCPTIGPYNRQTLEFVQPKDATEERRAVLKDSGFEEVNRPTDPRATDAVISSWQE